MIRIVSLRQTCEACPSQWEAELEDGRRLYVRYRFGGLTYGFGEDIGSAVRASLDMEPIVLGDELDGFIEEGHMLVLLMTLEDLVWRP